MKIFPFAFIIILFGVACTNNSEEEKTTTNDTMAITPSFGGGHEEGTNAAESPTYPKPVYSSDTLYDTLKDTDRSYHGVNVDTSQGSSQLNN